MDNLGRNKTGSLSSFRLLANRSSRLASGNLISSIPIAVIYQDSAGNLHVVNDTILGTSYIMDGIIDVTVGSALSITSTIRTSNGTVSAFLFYQGKDSRLKSCASNGTARWNSGELYFHHAFSKVLTASTADSLELIPPLSPISAFSYGPYNGTGPNTNVVYPISAHSLVVDYWVPVTLWTTGTAPTALRSVDTGSQLATVALGKLYAVVGGSLTEFHLTEFGWTQGGTVPTT
jgi:hypothetical protein